MSNNQVLLASRRSKQHGSTSSLSKQQYSKEFDPDEPSMNFLAMGIKLKTKSLLTANTNSLSSKKLKPGEMIATKFLPNKNETVFTLDSIGVSYELDHNVRKYPTILNDHLPKQSYHQRKSYDSQTGTNLKKVKLNHKIISVTRSLNTIEIGKELNAQKIVLNCNCDHLGLSDKNNRHVSKSDCLSCKYKGKLNFDLKTLAKVTHTGHAKKQNETLAISATNEANAERVKSAQSKASKGSSQNMFPFPNLQKKSDLNVTKIAGSRLSATSAKNLKHQSDSKLANRNSSDNSPSAINNEFMSLNNESIDEEVIPKLTLWLV